MNHPQTAIRRQPIVVPHGKISHASFVLLLLLFSLVGLSRADIRRPGLPWSETIPGTEDIALGPRIDLSGWNTESRNLRSAFFQYRDLTEADFSHSWLDGAHFDASSVGMWRPDEAATLVDANFTGATITGASFSEAIGFVAHQLYSTASYQSGNLNGIALEGLDLSGWDFSNQDLTGASFHRVRPWRPLPAGQTDLTGADFSGAVLVGADFYEANVTGANLIGANLKHANATFSLDGTPIVDSTTVYNQWTRFHPDFDPSASGMTFEASPSGDFDGDNVLDSADLTLLERLIRSDLSEFRWWQDEIFDLNQDNELNDSDLSTWLFELKQAIPGDADLNGSVEFSDFLILSDNFGESGWWSQGDFDLSGEVQFADFLILSGNFGTTANSLAAAVPEPSAATLGLVGILGLAFGRKRTGRRRLVVEDLERRELLAVDFTVNLLAEFEALFVTAADLDGDGDADIIATTNQVFPRPDKVVWFENLDGSADFAEPSVVEVEFTESERREAVAADFDADGDLDIGVSLWPGRSDADGFWGFSWYENTDGQFELIETVRFSSWSPSIAYGDVDGDGDADVVTHFYLYENVEQTFQETSLVSLPEHESGFLGSTSTQLFDIDGDDDLDLLTTSSQIGVRWFENEDGEGFFGPPRTVDLTKGIRSSHTADLDGDGDIDVLAATAIASGGLLDAEVMWFENLDGSGSFGKPRRISQEHNQPFNNSLFSTPEHLVRTADIDGDGDLDVLTALTHGPSTDLSGRMSWFENTSSDNEQRFGSRREISTSPPVGWAWSAERSPQLVPADVDNDGDFEIVSISTSLGGIVWYEPGPIEQPLRIPGDADRNGEVAFADFLVLSANFGQQVDAVWADGDFNEDGKVDFADFLILSENFGASA